MINGLIAEMPWKRIEFARCDPNSRWGSMRAAMGHPELLS